MGYSRAMGFSRAAGLWVMGGVGGGLSRNAGRKVWGLERVPVPLPVPRGSSSSC